MRFFTPLLLAAALAAPGRAADPPKVDLTKGVTFTGRADAPTVQVRSRVSGYVERVAVKDGATVKKGDLLAEIDDRLYKSKLDVAKAELAAAHAQAKRAAADVGRIKEMVKSGIVSKEEVERTEAAFDEAKSHTEAAKAAVALAELNLSFTKVRAPIDGRLGHFATSAGNLVKADETALVTLVAPDRVWVTFDVDERTALAFARAWNDKAKPVVEVGLADEDGYPHAAAFEAIGHEVDVNTGTVRFRAKLDNPKGLIAPGMFLRVRLTVQPGK